MTDHPAPRLSVAALLGPRSVAVIGASEDTRKFGSRVLRNTIDGGFEGPIVPVNPKRTTLFGLPAYPLVSAAPQAVDLAVIAVPRPLVLDHVKDCAAAGVGGCLVISAGFAEAGEDGRAVQDEMVAVARAAGMRLIGPNCLGLINTGLRLPMNSSPAMQQTPLVPGHIGLLSQSGALMATIYNRGVGAGARFSTCVSVGNQADLEIADFMMALAEDAATRVVTIYCEGFVDAGRFVAAARACRDAGKPVLMVKAGRSVEGQRVTRSHTASLATSQKVLEAVCREAGVALLDDTNGMILAAEMIARHGVANRDGILVVTGSGGAAAIVTDRFADRGLRLARFSDRTRHKLEALYVPSQLGNPLDLGALRENSFTDFRDGGLGIAAADPDVGAVLIPVATQPRITEGTRDLAETALAAGKPALVCFEPGNAADGAREAVRELGLIGVETIDEALRVLACWAAPRAEPPAPERPADLPDGPPFPGFEPGPLGENAVKRELARYGIPVTREAFATTVEEALAAAEAIGWPVALKGTGPDLVHKSDVGAVRLGLADASALRAAWDAMHAALGDAIDGGLVAEMATAEVEMILGIKHDAEFGAMLLLGFGGVLVEVIGDTVMVPAPAHPARIEALLRTLTLAPLLDGVRGRPPLDVAAACDAAARLSWLAADAGPRLAELDVNPLFVRAKGEGVVAVDARAMLAGSGSETE